jgi:hypothetical protein
MKYTIFFGIVIAMTGCYYGINKKTSEIGNLNTDCLASTAWAEILKEYSTKKIEDHRFIVQLNEFASFPFETELLYFDAQPREIIAVSKDHYSVRYVFNPVMDGQILDGLSEKLNEKAKRRVRNRVQEALMKYQCEEGKKKAVELLNE